MRVIWFNILHNGHYSHLPFLVQISRQSKKNAFVELVYFDFFEDSCLKSNATIMFR
ncbi:MAG: hypothetical protein ACI976_000843 [Aureispira sp.]|jgi:hypothetical protein